MGRPRWGREKELGLCEYCGDTVTVPPGRYYRGLRYHKQCARLIRQQDFSNEVTEPFLNQVEEDIERILEPQ